MVFDRVQDMPITSTDVTNAFPELLTVPSSSMTWAVTEAYGELDATTLGTDLDKAALYLAAHLAAMASGTGRVTTEEHVGPVGRSMAALTGLAATDYNLTRYGMMYSRFIRNTVDYWVAG